MSKHNNQIDMSEYDLDSPPNYNDAHYTKLRRAHEARVKGNMRTRECHNPDCGWRELVDEKLRFCPACGWEIKGWKSRWVKGVSE